MNTTTTSQLVDKINFLAVGLITAAGIHMALNLFSVSSVLASAHAGLLGIIFTALKLSWTVAGFLAGGYVAYNTWFMFHARDFTKARTAAIGALVLPLVGITGLITGFALIPLGAAILLLFRLPNWQAAFGIEVPVQPENEVQAEDQAEAQYEAGHRVEAESEIEAHEPAGVE
jgi:hypothetical protein